MSTIQIDPENSCAIDRYEVTLTASDNEVSRAVNAQVTLNVEGIHSRVALMPSWEIFEQQPKEDRNSALRRGVKARVAIEQASTLGCEWYVGDSGVVIRMKSFGAAAPLKKLQKKFGFEPANLVAAAKSLLMKQ